MVYIPYEHLNITSEDEKVCSFLVKGGFFVRNVTLFSGGLVQSEHDLIGFKYDKNFIPFIVLTEQKGGVNASSHFRAMAAITFFSKYFRANTSLYILSESPQLEIIEFGQRQIPRILVCPISNFDGSILPEVGAHFSGLNQLTILAKSGDKIKKCKKAFDTIWHLSEFFKVHHIERLIHEISLEKPSSEEYTKAYGWLSKELLAHYSLCLLQIVSRTFLIDTSNNRSGILTNWFKGELTETRVEGELSALENKTIDLVNYIVENNVIAYRLPYLVNKYLYGTEELSSDELSLILKLLNETSFKELRYYIERK